MLFRSNPKYAAQRCIAVCQGNADPGDSRSNIDEKVQAGVQAALAQLGLTPELLVQLKTRQDVEAQQPEPVAPPKRKPGRPKKVVQQTEAQ